ncbi:uncharacterized protein LOC121989646 [Zingiber officinale]|uniref:Uncharacterized protein n=1 Tax=Zingiber officinale TaxID=94328 RepID=A0A8J5L202_ZINOF|nr:uncharacterized protein LOC121989646 [Zingiber officinale]XP_042399748.1 uncharacterized protein LOC121989646 [Zingiber officinale]XP_042399749.1 uncharacterized protein LOC121989646 [Zingiber officinale]XP_042399750.1 uncharacterized protein LOC121989646 [Zingiber officinale]KAG6498281.1 hypothetical protein ZIOFF_046193 [Zingiber officinale]
MDRCPFIRIIVGNLALKVLVPPAPSASPCFAKIRFGKFPQQTANVPIIASDGNSVLDNTDSIAGLFHLSKADLDRIAGKSSLFASSASRDKLNVSVYTGSQSQGGSFWLSSGKLLGKFTMRLDLKGIAKDGGTREAMEFHSGWVSIGKKTAKIGKGSPSSSWSSEAQLYLTVKAEPDPRFVFEFDGVPECSPQVLQVKGKMRQPVFTCKFSCRNAVDRDICSRAAVSESRSSRKWLSSFGSEREQPGKERKGWSVTIHDLSGSPVALASMVTPFVATPGTDRVNRSNPGAWLVLRPVDGTWTPWGRLEAWRERGGAGAGDNLGYRFALLPDDTVGTSINLSESTISTVKGGQFVIDLTGATGPSRHFSSHRGFVMSVTVAGEGRGGRPTVEVAAQHIGYSEDAAVFVALAAAVDLSMDACRLFSQRLRKGLSAPDLLR